MATQTGLTPDDLITMPGPEGVYYELSEGELITVGKARFLHERVKYIIQRILMLHFGATPAAAVLSETMFTLGPDTARIPDVSVVSEQKFNSLPLTTDVIPFAPDLAIEIISESEPASDAETKVHQYLAAGVAEVWQVYPDLTFVRVRTREGYHDVKGEQLMESAVLPGFSCPVQQFFA